MITLSSIEGVYVPSLYEVLYTAEGRIKEFKPKNKNVPLRIRKRFVKDLNSAYFPLEWLIPYIQIIHDRITLEIMRGCPNTCRFCQARQQYFPYRKRDIENVLNLASSISERTGYEEISLCGLSVSDYTNIEELLTRLISQCKDDFVSVSLPSIKPKTLVGNLSSLIATIKKTGLTFAPEAGAERLRKILAKDFDTDSFFKAIEQAYASGYQHIKLYFMIGLPGEEEEDLAAILGFAAQVSELRKKTGRSAAQINISINPLIPKPHTAFQWFKMEGLNSLRHKQDYLLKNAKNKKLKIRFHNLNMSFLEGVLSRGDRRLSEVILSVFNKGARFDAWDDHFIFGRWLEAFKETGVDPDFYLQEKAKEEFLPWDFLDLGVSKDVLLGEYDKVVDIG